MSKKNDTLEVQHAHNVVSRLADQIAEPVFPQASYSLAVTPRRLPKAGKAPEGKGTAEFIGKAGADPKATKAVRLHLRITFNRKDLAFGAIVDAVARGKHLLTSGSKGGATPKALRDEIERSALAILGADQPEKGNANPRMIGLRALESAADFLIKTAPKAPKQTRIAVLLTFADGSTATIFVPLGNGQDTPLAETVIQKFSAVQITKAEITKSETETPEATKETPEVTPDLPKVVNG